MRPRTFHVMAKPTGAACNLRCDYCFFLKKEKLYPDGEFRMSEAVHDAYLEQLFSAGPASQVTVAWQGGEPTLMGLDFFRRSLSIQKSLTKPGMVVENTFQTNGILLDDEWCRFFREHRFLVGLSLDGPRRLHDIYRKDRRGTGTGDQVLRALRLLQKHRVDFNILCAVHSQNAEYPLEIYRFFRDRIHTPYVQFIPIVERDNESGYQEGNRVTERSVRPDQFGRFLTAIFTEWIKRDVGRMFVMNFEGVLAGWLGMAGTLCLFAPVCGQGLALEDNGDVYSCDHFVEPDHFLGNLLQTPLAELATSTQQQRFGQDKRTGLPQFCRRCDYLFACNGECPKNRFTLTPEGEAGLNYLCEGYKLFFRQADPALRQMAELIRQGRPAEEIMKRGKF